MSPPIARQPIETHCLACGSGGVTYWDRQPGFTLDDYLAGLRARCPDCGAGGRTAMVLEGPPADPELAQMWEEMQGLLDDEQRVIDSRPGRNQPCPCGSGAKYKRCCG